MSSWDKLKKISKYHFRTDKIDPKYDTVIQLGHLHPTWFEDLDAILDESKAATWETRGFKGKETAVPRPELIDEEYDLKRAGADPKMIITNLAWNMPVSLQKISDSFAFEDTMNRIHVQMPGQLWNIHIDKLYKWFPEKPEKVMRVFVALTDWQQGQFWNYGNYIYQQWRAGDVTTFDWQNVPHATANSSHTPRLTLQITGIKTRETAKFLKKLKSTPNLLL